MRVINGNLFFSIYNGNAFKIINPHCRARQSHLQLQSTLRTEGLNNWLDCSVHVGLLAGVTAGMGAGLQHAGQLHDLWTILVMTRHLQHPTPHHHTTENIFQEMIIITWIRKKIISYKAVSYESSGFCWNFQCKWFVKCRAPALLASIPSIALMSTFLTKKSAETGLSLLKIRL